MTDRLAATALRILAPRARLLGAGDEDALQNVNTSKLPNGSFCWVQDEAAFYVLHKDSAAAPSGVVVVAPSSGPGRWIILGSGTVASGQIIVPDIAALALLPAPVDGETAFVLTVRSSFVFATGSTIAADGITVVADSGATGKWLRTPVNDLSWAYQSSWYLDAGTGDDEADGSTAVTALQTAAELSRRLQNQLLQQRTIARLLTDIDEYLQMSVLVKSGSPFVLMGDPTAWQTILSGTFTGVTAINRTANPPNAQQIEDTLVADWTPYIGFRIRLTSGANIGATAWIVKNLGGGQARTTAFIANTDPVTRTGLSIANVSPALGNSYVVERTPGLGSLSLQVKTHGTAGFALRAIIDSIELGKNAASPTLLFCIAYGASAPNESVADGEISFSRMRFLSEVTGGDSVATLAQGCFFYNGGVWSGSHIAAGGVLRSATGATTFQSTSYSCNYRNDFLLQGILLGTGSGLLRTDLVGFSIWDTSGTAIELFAGDVMECFAKVYGAGAGDNGIQCESGAMVRYGGAANLPNVRGASDVDIANAAYTWEQVAAGVDGGIWDTIHNCGVLARLEGAVNAPPQASVYNINVVADIAATPIFLAVPPKGLFACDIYVAVKTAGAAGDQVTLTLAWTDDSQAETQVVFSAVSVSALGFYSARVLIETDGLVNPTYAVTFPVKTGNPVLSLRISAQQDQ